jgi:hypothetical protein
MQKVLEFVEKMCWKYCIDESHNVTHSLDCIQFANLLLDENQNVSRDEKTVILFAAAVHDTVDKKYTQSSLAVKEVRDFFKSIDLPHELIEAIVSIITTMSYSYLLDRKKNGQSFPDLGKWQNAYDIVRHADLLCSYRVKRCLQYQKHLTPYISDEDAMERVRHLFQVRVFAYKVNGWLTLEKAVELSIDLEKEAKKELLM